MPVVSTLFSLRLALFLVQAVSVLVDVTAPLHLREEYAKERAQLALETLSGRHTRSDQTFCGWHVRRE